MISYSPAVISRAIAQASGISRAPGMEGLSLTAYPDPATGGEPWTIGRGSTMIADPATGAIRAVRPGDVITEAQADAMLIANLRGSLQIVIAYTVPELNGDQLGALTSFVNNVGPGVKGLKDGFVRLKNGSPSTLIRYVNAAEWQMAAGQFGLWDLGNGKPMPGLVKRRAIERDVFLCKLDMTSAMIPQGWTP